MTNNLYGFEEYIVVFIFMNNQAFAQNFALFRKNRDFGKKFWALFNLNQFVGQLVSTVTAKFESNKEI